MTDNRINPDQLLHQAKIDERKTGKLKIFFGACAGVGKTYAMMQAAQSKFNENLKVVIGIIETHGREETAKQLEGIPRLPLKAIDYQGIKINEFDLDAALELNPDILIVDELAHTNVVGTRHPKRWQDVQEILENGIDVYTTLNVQHLESLNDLVKSITGIKINETVPDSIFDNADEIVLVDIPSEIILERLHDGKVYLGDFAKQRAAQHFFKIENLIALREIALRKTAENVDALRDVYKKYRENKASITDKLLVCIPPSPYAIKLIRQAKQLATKIKSDWTAVYVENDEYYELSHESQNEIKSMLNLAERLGAQTKIIQHTNVGDAICEYVQKNQFTKLILGSTAKPKWKRLFQRSLMNQLIDKGIGCDLIISSESAQSKFSKNDKHVQSDWLSLFYSITIIAIATLLGLPAKSWIEPETVLMIYIAGIVVIAMSSSRPISLFSVILAAFCYDFFYMSPHFKLASYNPRDLITLGVLLLTSYMISTQTYRLKQQTLFASQREKYASHLLELSRKLMLSNKPTKIAEVLNSHISDLFDSLSIIWVPDKNDSLEIIAPSGIEIDLKETSVVQWVYKSHKRAGIGTDTMPSALGYYFPIAYGTKIYGVQGIIPKDHKISLDKEQLVLIEALLIQCAMAFQRCKPQDVAISS